MSTVLDIEKLKGMCDAHKFRGFEREIEQAVERESHERRRRIEDAKRAKEKRARKKRLKTFARASS